MTVSPSQEDLDLIKLYRDALVAERRRLVRSAVELWQAKAPTDPTAGVSWSGDIKKLQDEIEAIDRTIEDEERLLDE